LTTTLQTFAMAGPAWDGSDEGTANKDMMKTQLNINEPDHLISSPASFHDHHPISTHFPATFHVFSSTPLEPYVKTSCFCADPIGPLHFPQDLRVRS